MSYEIGLLLLVTTGVGEIYTLIDEGGRCSLTAADRESAAQERGSVSEILMRQLPFLLQQRSSFFTSGSRARNVSCTVLRFCMLYLKKKSVAPCKHWIQRCEINIALLKSTTLSHSKDSQPSLSTKVEESTFRILTQLTLP